MRTDTYNALQEIEHERERQVSDEGWTPEHDDAHGRGELALAAGCYAIGSADETFSHAPPDREALLDEYWPWDRKWWKRTDRRRQLVKAGALIVAELERLERASRK